MLKKRGLRRCLWGLVEDHGDGAWCVVGGTLCVLYTMMSFCESSKEKLLWKQ